MRIRIGDDFCLIGWFIDCFWQAGWCYREFNANDSSLAGPADDRNPAIHALGSFGHAQYPKMAIVRSRAIFGREAASIIFYFQDNISVAEIQINIDGVGAGMFDSVGDGL